MSAKTVRARLGKLMRETLADEQAHGDWTYRAIRPLPVPPTWTPGQKVISDCSWGLKLLCRWADGPDPMGTLFGPYGNSQTICAHLPHLDLPSELLVGDPVTFGRNGDEHAASCLEPGADPLLWSDGHQGAPNAYRLSWDTRIHQLLRLMHDDPHPPPTAQDILRAKTGYWPWVQWRLGEGDWKHYLPANPKVRPNVPANIVVMRPTWLPMFRQFVWNRHNGNKPTGLIVRPG